MTHFSILTVKKYIFSLYYSINYLFITNIYLIYNKTAIHLKLNF